MATACMLGAILLTVFVPVSSITIPDNVPFTRKRLVYHKKWGNFYEANRVCRANGGYLLLIDSLAKAQTLLLMDAVLNDSMHDVITRMVRHDDEKLYAHDDRCQEIVESQWSYWRSPSDGTFNSEFHCVWAEAQNFRWVAKRCDQSYHFVCEYDGVPCEFTTSTVSFSAALAPNASKEACEDTCRTITGCFASAPSVTADVHLCVFLVVNDTSNPMSYMNCAPAFEVDSTTDPSLFSDPADPVTDPVDCVAPTSTHWSDTDQTALSDFLAIAGVMYGNFCTQYVVTETIYVTPTLRDVIESTESQITIDSSMTSSVDLDLSPGSSSVCVTQDVTQTVTQSVMQTVTVTQTVTFDASLAPSCPDLESSPVINTTPLDEGSTPLSSVQPSSLISSSIPSTSATSSLMSETPDQNITFEEELQSLVRELTVDRSSLSSTRRKKESAADGRWSSQTLGAAAIIIIATVVTVVVLLDSPSALKLVKKCHKKATKRRRSHAALASSGPASVLDHIKAIRSGALPPVPRPSVLTVQSLDLETEDGGGEPANSDAETTIDDKK